MMVKNEDFADCLRGSGAAICLEPKLEEADGWSVLSSLKGDLATRHIPVWAISAGDDLQDAIRMGAVGTLRKSSASRNTMKAMLQSLARWTEQPAPAIVFVGHDPNNGEDGNANALAGLLPDTATCQVPGSLDDLNTVLADRRHDLLVVQPGFPPQPHEFTLRALEETEMPPDMPVLLFVPGDLPSEEEMVIKRWRKRHPLRVARTREQLVDEVSFLLHRPLSSLPEDQRKAVEKLHDPSTVLAGKEALIVDDDIRNIFAMTSLLERFDMQVRSSETGEEAIEILEREEGIDIVLMDIMMPKLDGYETTRAIRQKHAFRNLPIIALTAKAMVGDREKCLEAGASDYVAKPVRSDYLIEILAKWLR